MRNFVRAALLALLAAGAVAPLAAQDIRALKSSYRSGFWWGIGLGAARAKLECSGCTNPDPQTFPMGDIHLGFTASPKLTFGLEFAGGSKTNGFYKSANITETVGDANLSAYFYPQAEGNFFVQAGLAGVAFQAKQGSVDNHVASGGLTLGVGYDFRFGRNASFTPTLRGVWGGAANMMDQNGNNLGGPKIKTSFIHAGVSILWH